MSSVTLHFEEFGSEAQPPLIILHGFFASNRNWRHVARQLADGYHVYSLDLRNHGSSPHNPLMDYPGMALDVKAFIECRGLTAVHLLGHSMGGKIAMWFALHYPESLQKLIIADIAPVGYQHSFDPLIDALLALPLDQLSNRKQADEWLSDSIDNPVFRQFLLQNLVLENAKYRWRINLDYFKQAGPCIAGFPDVDKTLCYSGSVKFLTGEKSKFVQPDAVFSLFPKATIQAIANAGHWLHVEAPAEFLDAVRDYLGDNP